MSSKCIVLHPRRLYFIVGCLGIGKVKLSVTKHHAMKVYGVVEAKHVASLIPALEGC